MLWPYAVLLLLLPSDFQNSNAHPGQQEQNTATTLEQPNDMADCLANFEQLVLITLDSALIVSCNVYRNLSVQLGNAQLKQAIQPVVDVYLKQVSNALNTSSSTNNYALKRDLLKLFKWTNAQIEKQRQQVLPVDSKEFHFQLISEDFLHRRKNTTQFDNLYLHFMENFQKLSDNLFANISKQSQYDEELLEILTEISNEEDLRTRDKLYDEFIEMYLFRSKVTTDNNNELV